LTTRAALLRREGTARDGRAFLVRPTRSDDAPALVALHDAVAAEGGLIAAVPGERSAVEEELMLSTLLSSGGLALTLLVDDAVAGQCLVSRRLDPERAHIGEVAIVVSNTSRGVGLGRLLMEIAMEWSRAVGLEKLSLSVFPSNERAIALYRSLGFVDDGHRLHQVVLPSGPHDLLVMGLRL